MNEKMKMLTGELYDAEAPELKKARVYAKNLCQNYNQLPVDADTEKYELLKKLFGKTGKNFKIEPNFFCDYGFNIEIGENFYINHNSVILDCAKVKFGNNVFVGPNCGFYTAVHPLKPEERNTFREYAKPITIGDNVWIGGSVTILPGVTIGCNTVIGAGSVVTKDIPANVLAFGNPCKPVRHIEE